MDTFGEGLDEVTYGPKSQNTSGPNGQHFGLRWPPPFVDSFMDGCREVVEAAEAAEAAKT